MDNIENLTRNLINSIHTSEEYTLYLKAKKYIDGNLSIRDTINSLKKAQIEMELNLKSGVLVSDEEKRKLQNLYTDLTLNENIDIYFRYERIIFETITDIYDNIINSIEMNLDFIE